MSDDKAIRDLIKHLEKRYGGRVILDEVNDDNIDTRVKVELKYDGELVDTTEGDAIISAVRSQDHDNERVYTVIAGSMDYNDLVTLIAYLLNTIEQGVLPHMFKSDGEGDTH